MKFSEINREIIKAKKTVWIFRLRTGAAVFLFLLSFSYVVTALLFGQSGRLGREGEKTDGRITVWAGSGENCFVLDLEDYLIGCLAGSIPAKYEPEALEAQAVLLRTMLIREYKESVERGQTQTGILETDGKAYRSRRQMKQMWGLDFAVNYGKICRAVEETRGIYLTYQGEPILASFFRVSGGRTRDGRALAGGGEGTDYSYLQSVICPKDYLSEDYLQGGRAAGLGHGLGMSQFGANEMAKNGAGRDEILHYFFTDITIDKFE